MFAYCLNNPVMYFDSVGMQPTDIYYATTGESESITKKEAKKEWVSRKDKRNGSDRRQKSGERERNVGHKNGEEHSRKPKGNGMPIKKIEGLTFPESVFQQAVVFIPIGGGLAMGLLYTSMVYGLFHVEI